MAVRIVIGCCLLAVCSSLRVIDNPGGTMMREFQTENGPVTLIVGKKTGRSMKLMDALKPFEVTSSLLTVNNDDEEQPERRGRLMGSFQIDESDVPVIEGVREPDDPNETKVFRNARIINNILITDEDDVVNDVSVEDEKTSGRQAKSLYRQARILTGPVDTEEQEQDSQSTSGTQLYPAYVHSQHYEPSRKGLVESGNSKDEKVVTYSYSTSGDKGEGKSHKDVIYGSGFAANPSKNPRLSSSGSLSSLVTYNFPQTKRSPAEFKQPTKLWDGFQPSSVPSRSPPTPNLPHFPTKTFNFPSSSPTKRQPSPNDFHVASNTNNRPVFSSQGQSHQFSQQPTNDIRQQIIRNNFLSQQQYQQQQQQQHQQKHRQQQKHQQQHYQPQRQKQQQQQQQQQPIYINQVRRNQHPHQIPTPHQAFGEIGGSLIHPGVIPANSQNFVVEEATFQTHPGAPAFSVPVPRPVAQVQQHQQGQQFYTHPDQYHDIPFYYEEVDNRHILDKMIDPIKKVGTTVRQTLIEPVLHAGQRFGDSLRLPERMDKITRGTVAADAFPVVGGAVAVATLGALGAYAASKYSFDDLKKLLPTPAARSSNANVPDVLLKLADDLENEDPSFIERFTSSTAWLESRCAQRIFCSLVTSTLREEEEKLEKKDAPLQSRQARGFFEKEISYLEDQINNLLDGLRIKKSQRESKFLRDAANEVVNAVKQRNCSKFTCSGKN